RPSPGNGRAVLNFPVHLDCPCAARPGDAGLSGARKDPGAQEGSAESCLTRKPPGLTLNADEPQRTPGTQRQASSTNLAFVWFRVLCVDSSSKPRHRRWSCE